MQSGLPVGVDAHLMQSECNQNATEDALSKESEAIRAKQRRLGSHQSH